MIHTAEVVLFPALFPSRNIKDAFAVVVADIFRATTTICKLFDRGAGAVIPVDSLERLAELKKKGFLTAGERDGVKIGFADYGNSPCAFDNVDFSGRKMALSTTNGTLAISVASPYATDLIIGAFSNFEAIVSELGKNKKDVIILCAGEEGEISPEDTLFAGALCARLKEESGYETTGSQSEYAIREWEGARDNPDIYLKNTRHYIRLQKLGYAGDIRQALRMNTSKNVPRYVDGEITRG